MLEPENPGMEMAKAFAEGAGKQSASNISEFLGGLFPFWGMKKKAVDVYVREIEQSNMSPEAKMMAIANTKKTFREFRNQAAIIDITCTTLGDGKIIDTDSLKNADSELINRLIDSSKFVSDEELQLLWGNVLAGELEHPGTTPKNVVRILSELSKEYATIFATLCSLRVRIIADTGKSIHDFGQEMMAFITSSYLQEMNINLDVILELEQLGLISFSNIGHYSRSIPQDQFPYIHIVYDNHVMTAFNTISNFPTGHIMLTKVGRCISRFAPAHYNQQHMDGIKYYLENNQKLKFSLTPGIRIIEKYEEGYKIERQQMTPPQTTEQ